MSNIDQEYSIHRLNRAGFFDRGKERTFKIFPPPLKMFFITFLGEK